MPAPLDRAHWYVVSAGLENIDKRSASAVYGKVLIKDTAIHDALKRLRTLTILEIRALAAETQATLSTTGAVTSDIQSIVSKNHQTLLHTHVVANDVLELAANTQDVVAESRDLTRQILVEVQALHLGA